MSVAQTPNGQRIDAPAITRGLLAFGVLAVAAYFVDGEAGKDWALRHSLPFMIGAPLLAIALPWRRYWWRDVIAVAVGCAAGFTLAAVFGGDTQDTDRWDWGFLYAGWFVLALAICLGAASLAKAVRGAIVVRPGR